MTPLALLALLALPARGWGQDASAETARRTSSTTKRDEVRKSLPVAPTLERRDPIFDTVQNNTDAVLIADLRRTQGAYVLPPNTAAVTLAGVRFQRTVELCPQLQELQQQSRTLSVRMAELMLDVGPLEAEVAFLQEQRRAADERAAQYSDYRVLSDAADERELDLLAVEQRSEALRAAHCSAGPCPSEVASELQDLEREAQDIKNELASLHARAATRERAYQEAVAKREQYDAEIQAREQAYYARLDAVQKLRDAVLEMYNVYARTSGATAELQYDSGWKNAVATLRRDNPQAWFQAIPTRDARVHVAMLAGVGTDAYLATNPAVLDLTVNGTSLANGAPMPALASYPEVISASLSLSLVSACVAYDPKAYDVERAASGLPLFGLTVSYDYPTVSAAAVSVQYNLWLLRELVSARYFGAGLLDALLEKGKATGAVAFVWGDEQARSLEQRRLFELRVLWQLLQQLWALTHAPVYDADAVRVYGGPLEQSAGIFPVVAEKAGLVVRSLTNDARYVEALRAVSVSAPADAGKRAVGAVVLATKKPTDTLRVRPTGAVLVSLDSDADRLFETIALEQTTQRPGLQPLDPALTATDELHLGGVMALGDAANASLQLTEAPVLRSASPASIERLTLRADSEVTQVLVQSIVVEPELSGDRTRIIANGLGIARRAVDRTCGWHQLTCAGLAWVARTELDQAALRARLDLKQSHRYFASDVVYRTGTTIFNP